MAETCFCGCGRAIPRFPLGTRSINKRGNYVSDRIAWAFAVFGEEAYLQEWFADGAEIYENLQAAMHGELDPRTLDEDPVRHWQEYGRNLEQVAERMGRPGIAVWLASQQRVTP